MNRRRAFPALSPLVLLPLALASGEALAYVGPGAGLGVIGTLFGIVAAIVLATFGLLWYPLKRAFAKKDATAGGEAETSDPNALERSRDDASAGPGDAPRDGSGGDERRP